MKHKQTVDTASETVTLWFLGWGFDDGVAKHIETAGDTILLWDYTDLNHNLRLDRWGRIEVVAWSMGVWAAERLIADGAIPLPSRATAICGTPMPCDAAMGIGCKAVEMTADNWGETNRAKFARKMALSAEQAATIAPLLARRTAADQQAELRSIAEAQKGDPPTHMTWDEAIVGLRDRIFPPAAQRLWWDAHAKSVREMDIPHWPFGGDGLSKR